MSTTQHESHGRHCKCLPHWASSKSNLLCGLRACRENKRSWLYRIRPSVTHEPFHPLNFPVEQLTGQGRV